MTTKSSLVEVCKLIDEAIGSDTRLDIFSCYAMSIANTGGVCSPTYPNAQILHVGGGSVHFMVGKRYKSMPVAEIGGLCACAVKKQQVHRRAA